MMNPDDKEKNKIRKKSLKRIKMFKIFTKKSVARVSNLVWFEDDIHFRFSPPRGKKKISDKERKDYCCKS